MRLFYKKYTRLDPDVCKTFLILFKLFGLEMYIFWNYI